MMHKLAALVLVAFPLAAPGQYPPPPPIKLTLHPAAAPVPALKYKLLPEQRDLTPGNAVQLYYRAFSPDSWGYIHRMPKFYEELSAARQAPLQEFRDGKWNISRYFSPLRDVDRAARRQYCEWEFTPRLREEGINMLLPDIQGFRYVGDMLAVRARHEIAQGKFDEAARTLQTAFAMSHHVGDGPILIQSLVGIAIASLTLDQVETWIMQPGAPNLYWSLTVLPRPFFDLRKALEGERVTSDHIFEDLRDMLRRPKLTPWNPPDIQGKIRLLDDLSERPTDKLLGGGAIGLLLATKLYVEAKQFLIGQGRSPAEVEALPVLQVILLHQVTIYDRFYDDVIKWQNLPYPVARLGMAQAERALRAQRLSGSDQSLATLLLPAVTRVQFATVRTQRRIDALRVVEALRLYAAAHDRHLPDTLADVTEAPIPFDVVTGQAFEYKRDGDRAALSGPPPSGEQPNNSGNVLRYELTVVR